MRPLVDGFYRYKETLLSDEQLRFIVIANMQPGDRAR
jgi:hypothetical protein